MQYEDKYLNRITSQHKVRPKYMEWLAALLDKIQDLKDLTEQLDAAFDLDKAAGAQLDMIGQLVGVSRLLNFEPIYAPSALLSDHDYRTILRARISLNQWDGTTEGIYRLWSGISPGAAIVVVDHQDMTMTNRIYGLSSPFESEYISRGYVAPKPQGVGINYEFVTETPMPPSGIKVAGVAYPGVMTTALPQYVPVQNYEKHIYARARRGSIQQTTLPPLPPVT
ncbi:MAG: DUF2612 domain-containing protein [Oscillospiraceae bacterium]|nr:DUF2612 domain-containing protein [Oscillospiraceae bacterium]